MTHHIHYHAPRLAGLGPVFWGHSIRGMAESLIAVFVGIYLLQLGYSFTSVMLFLMAQGLTWMILLYPATKLIMRLGPPRVMALSMIGNVIYFALLSSLPTYNWPLLLPAAVWGMFVALYWPAMRLLFARGLLHKRAGRYVSAWSALTVLASGLAPAVGGLVATLAGIQNVYLVGIGMFIAAAFPLLFDQSIANRGKMELGRFWGTSRRELRDLLANLCEAYRDNTQNYVWPLLIFLIVPTYAGVGVLSSVIVITAVLIAIYVGRREETRGERPYIRRGSLFTGLAHTAQIFVQNAGQIFGANLVTGLGSALYLTPYNTRYYEKIQRYGLSYLCGMQLFAALAYVVGFGLLFLLALALPMKTVLIIAILAAIPASFGIRLIR